MQNVIVCLDRATLLPGRSGHGVQADGVPENPDLVVLKDTVSCVGLAPAPYICR